MRRRGVENGKMDDHSVGIDAVGGQRAGAGQAVVVSAVHDDVLGPLLMNQSFEPVSQGGEPLCIGSEPLGGKSDGLAEAGAYR